MLVGNERAATAAGGGEEERQQRAAVAAARRWRRGRGLLLKWLWWLRCRAETKGRNREKRRVDKQRVEVRAWQG